MFFQFSWSSHKVHKYQSRGKRFDFATALLKIIKFPPRERKRKINMSIYCIVSKGILYYREWILGKKIILHVEYLLTQRKSTANYLICTVSQRLLEIVAMHTLCYKSKPWWAIQQWKMMGYLELGHFGMQWPQQSTPVQMSWPVRHHQTSKQC